MMQFLVTAPCSGSGKTTLTCALLAALKRRGADPCAFKSGPDYIDPMFHRAVLGVESHNLDLFFSAPDTVRALYAQGAAGHGAAVCEGAMGFYDGLGGVTDTASAWHLADTLGLPVLLVVPAKGASLTLAAQINGLKTFRTPSRIVGVLLNAAAQLLLKAGVRQIGAFEFSAGNIWPIGLQLAKNLPIFGGLSCYVISVVVWILALSRVEVSIAYPMLSIGYIVNAGLAWWLFNEAVGPQRLVGIAVIIVGVLIVAKS